MKAVLWLRLLHLGIFLAGTSGVSSDLKDAAEMENTTLDTGGNKSSQSEVADNKDLVTNGTEEEMFEETRIIGGTSTMIGQYPFYVSIYDFSPPSSEKEEDKVKEDNREEERDKGKGDNDKVYKDKLNYKIPVGYLVFIFSCGGSLLTEKFVVSAAHCLVEKEPEKMMIGMASFQIGVDQQQQRLVGVMQTYIYPKYGLVPLSYGDIGLILLAQEVEWNQFIRPVAIIPRTHFEDYLYPESGEALTLVGNGKRINSRPENVSEAAEPTLPYVLKEAKLFVPDHRMCPLLKIGHICAGWTINGQWKTFDTIKKRDKNTFISQERGSCFGDSGGPIVNKFGQLMGIVSWGVGEYCAYAGTFDFYTNFNYGPFRDWVIEVMSNFTGQQQQTNKTDWVTGRLYHKMVIVLEGDNKKSEVTNPAKRVKTVVPTGNEKPHKPKKKHKKSKKIKKSKKGI